MSNTNKLQNIKEIIEDMNKSYQLEILKLLTKESLIFSENNNGVFINLSDLDSTIIYKLEKYIDFVYQQQNQLDSIESKKDSIKDEFFKSDKRVSKYKIDKANKEETCIISDDK